MRKSLKARLFHTEIVMSSAYYMRNKKPRLKIMTAEQTVNYIEKHKCSVARFGEGEFEIILESGYKSNNGVSGFQSCSLELVKRLGETLATRDPNLLICIPHALNNIWGRTSDSRNFWYYWSERDDQRNRIADLIRKAHGTDTIFGDTQISRPYIAWKSKHHADRMFPRLKRLWEDRDVLIVEGVKTRLGVGNDLFTGTRSVKRILAPATNAFSRLDDIRNKIQEVYAGELVIMALGPTATILASELSAKGIQAIDIGHVDIEYEWYLRGSKNHAAIPGKFVNEASQGSVADACNDDWYNRQIVAWI